MQIMNQGIRNAIKAALVKKYVDGLGIAVPSLPQRPEFDLPPAPDLSGLSAASAAGGSLSGAMSGYYTSGYSEAVSGYMEAVKKARAERDANVSAIRSRMDEASGDASALYAEIEAEENRYNEARAEAARLYGSSGQVKFSGMGSSDSSEVSRASSGEMDGKMSEARALAALASQSAVLRQYERYVRKEKEVYDRLVSESIKFYNDSKEMYTKAVSGITEYFRPGGDGDAWVERECDKIDRTWEDMSELFKELSTDISVLVAKIPNPDVLVVGSAVGSPNPGFKIMVFMEGFKKVMTDITKIANYVKDMIATAKEMGLDIMNAIGVFASMARLIEALKGNADKQFASAVKQFRKRTKWSAEIDKTDEDGEYVTKRAGYKYADIDVDYDNRTIALLGYKCYCTKNKDFLEGYKKNGGSFTDAKGKSYYYLKEDDVTHASDDYASLDGPDESGGALGETLAAADYDYDAGTTTLQLSDGRVVTIDYLAEPGDYIRLNDGTLVHVV